MSKCFINANKYRKEISEEDSTKATAAPALAVGSKLNEMRKRHLIIFPLILFFYYSYGQSDTDEEQNEKENFNIFLDKFVADSAFQMSRIKFPVKFVTMNFDTYQQVDTVIAEGKWNYDPIYLQEEKQSQIYDNFDMRLRDTDERIFSWHGIRNGINIHYYFKRIDGKWYLVAFEDTSA